MSSSSPSPPYPTAYQIEEMFANRGRPEIFNGYLAETCDVLVMGGEDFHLGGRYHTVQDFHDEIYGHVTSALKVETFKVEVLRVIGGGESAWAAVESLSTATSKYDKPYADLHVDLVRFNSEGKIAQLREFFDTRHVHDHVEEHHSKTDEKK